MSLIKCKECKKEISSEADVCPHCGKKVKRTSRLAIVLSALFLIFLFKSLIEGNQETTTPRAPPTEADIAQSADGACMLFIKQSLNDPNSADFEHSSQSVISHKGDTWTATRPVRAKNAFGAYIKTDFTCTMTRSASGDWNALSIKQR